MKKLNSFLMARAAKTKDISEQLVKEACMVAYKDPKIAQCDMVSIAESVVKAGALDLSLNETLREAYLAPYKGKGMKQPSCKLMVMAKGWTRMIKRYPSVSTIESGAVHENDVFVCRRGTEQELLHEINLSGDRGDFVCAWAMVTFADGQKQFVVMPKADIEKRRMKGMSNSPAWREWYDEMACAKVLRHLAQNIGRETNDLATLFREDAPAHDENGEVFDLEPESTQADVLMALEASE